MIRLGMVGLGKMGISHLAIANTHADAQVVAACDNNTYLTDVLSTHTGLRCYPQYDAMLRHEKLDAVIISTPSRLHGPMVREALQRGLHVFCEKPFVLDVNEGESLVELADAGKLVTQVGYHFRFVAAFAEAARIVNEGALGSIHHVRAEAYGPVVLRPKGSTWRSARAEGGGALYDYACHVADLVNFIAGPPASISGVIRNAVFSKDVDDEVYCSMTFANGASGQLAVNWSDESHRKMFTRISVWGSNGRLTADRQECQVFLREPHASVPQRRNGWTVQYTTDLTREVWFYLRGEEYSAQIDYFIQSVKLGRTNGLNSFRSALDADRVVAMLAGKPLALPANPAGGRASLLTRMFGA